MSRNPCTEKTDDRDMQVWNLHLQFQTQAQIAHQLGITQSAVCQILTRIRKRLSGLQAREMAAMRIEMTEQLWQLVCEAMTAWKESQKDARTTVTRTPSAPPEPINSTETSPPQKSEIPPLPELEDERPSSEPPSPHPFRGVRRRREPLSADPCSGAGGRPGTETTVRKQTGNVAYLRLARDVMADIRRIWGLDLPQPTDGESGEKEWPKALIGVDIDKI